MFIREIKRQHRRDFIADLECECCGHIEREVRGYDDTYFHREVIPKEKCPYCGRSARELGTNYRPLTTKYPDWMQV